MEITGYGISAKQNVSAHMPVHTAVILVRLADPLIQAMVDPVAVAHAV